MPKLAPPLTEERIAGLAPRERPYRADDGHGLYLLVEPTGKKRWRMSFHLRGRESTVAFGNFPDLSLADARQQRRQAQAATPTTRKLHLSMNDQGGLVIENRPHRMALTAQQVAALRAFLIATGDETEGE